MISSVVSTVLPNSTATIPWLPARSNASATISPSAASLAAMLATARRPAGPCRALAERFNAAMVSMTASSIPSTSSTGLAPAARHLRPSCTSTSASTVAVVVPSPATSLVCFETSRSTCAPIFSNGHSSSISLAMLAPSREMIGVPIGRSMIAFMPFGPSVPRTALASLAMPLPNAARAASSCSMIFGIGCPHLSLKSFFAWSYSQSNAQVLGPVLRVRRFRRSFRLWHKGRFEIEAHGKQAAAESAVEFGVDADAPEARDVGSKAVGFQPRSLRVDESGLIGTWRPNDGAPFKIAPYQFFTVVIDRQATKLHQCQGDDRFGRVAHPDEMVEQRHLSALECLDQECLTQIIQVAIGLGTEGLLKR